jgi:MEMO1 family protein
MWHRKPVYAGSFYPSNPEQLKRDIEKYLNKAQKKDFKSRLLGLVTPHAGYVYSGPVAAHSYKQLIGSGTEIAIVLTPSHRARFSGASVINAGIYETPLGQIGIDEKIGQALLNEGHFSFIKEVHGPEHSLEVQAPFLQIVLDNFLLVPIVIGDNNFNYCKAVADELYNVLKDEKRKFVIIISTDLSHYHPYSEAVKIDHAYIDALKTADEDKLESVVESRKAEACGHGPVLIGLMLSKKLGANSVEILHYANSGDTSGSKDEVVGYLAAAILK